MKTLNKKGQALVEYVLIIALVTVIAVSLIRIFEGYIKDSITKTSCELVGGEFYLPNGAKIGQGEGKCK